MSDRKGHKGSAVHYAPVPQEMSTGQWPTEHDLEEYKKLLEQKEAELHEVEKQLQQHHHVRLGVSTHIKGQQQEVALAADGRACQDQFPAATAATVTVDTTKNQPMYLTAHTVVQQEQQQELLLVRWKCLLEDKTQLTVMMRMAAGRLADFEPGETPMRDVTCSVITHQLDTPFFSCCFQR